MTASLSNLERAIRDFDFTKLFIEELGWDRHKQDLRVSVGGSDYMLRAAAEKRGMLALVCTVAPDSAAKGIPPYTVRCAIERQVRKHAHEHIIVFVDEAKTSQVWQWVRREPGRSLAVREHSYGRVQRGSSLAQKLRHLSIGLDEEDAVTLLDVTGRAKGAFDVEKVTKKFYRDFDSHRVAFLSFIDGIGDTADREWYASVMLNRLMFVYFIQRKGFLDGDHDYLRNRLDRCKKEQGKDKFYNFYRYFLLRLFHEGFGKRRKDRAADLEKLLGNIPYLNGGLFDVHELERPERYGKDIQIPDKAFERIFNYFDQYQWLNRPGFRGGSVS